MSSSAKSSINLKGEYLMRVDKLIAQYFEAERSVGKANHFKDSFDYILEICDDPRSSLSKLAELLDEKRYGTNFIAYLLQCDRQYSTEPLKYEDEQHFLRCFKQIKDAIINRTEFKQILAPHASILGKAVEQAQKEFEEAKSKIEVEFQKYVTDNFGADGFASFLLGCEPIKTAFLGFLLQDDEEE